MEKGIWLFPRSAGTCCKCLLSKSALRWAKGILPKWCCESKPNTAPARATQCWFCLMDASADDSQIDAPGVPMWIKDLGVSISVALCAFQALLDYSHQLHQAQDENELAMKGLWIMFEHFSLWNSCWVSWRLQTAKRARLVMSREPRQYNA